MQQQLNAIGQHAADTAAKGAQTLLNTIFEVVRQAFAVAVTRGFMTVLIFCAIALIAVFFLKDIPLAGRTSSKPEETKDAASEQEVIATH